MSTAQVLPVREAGGADAKIDGLRARKKRATRQRISNVATQLFTERGFDQVTIDDVAVAADVSKMTVFNYFRCKEDLYFDRSGEAQRLLGDALANRRRSPLSTLQTLTRELVETRHPLMRANAAAATFWKVVADSPALRAHARKVSAELERDIGRMLQTSVDAPKGDPTARLVAAILVGTWRVAFREALHRSRTRRAAAVRDAVLELLDLGFAAAALAARGTPYV